MKSTRSSEQRKVIIGAVLGLCILGGALGWQKWQTRRGEWSFPVYTRIKTAGSFVYQEVPFSEYKKSLPEMSLALPPRYVQSIISGKEEYTKLAAPTAITHSVKAHQYEAKRNFSAAVGELRKAVQADPNDPTMQWQLGEALQRNGQTEEAIKVLTPVAQEPDIVGKLAANLLRKIQRNPNYGQPKR